MLVRTNKNSRLASRRPSVRRREGGFTLVETMVVIFLVSILVISSAAGIMAMDRSSRRLADHTAAMSVVEAKMHSIRASTYNPPTSPFTAATVFLTNSTSISLAKSGTNFMVAGTIVSRIQPVSSGHLVTVTGTFAEPSGSFSVSLQSIINRYTTGQQ
jgi:prepilin-type N-terminal cleavage/methylation domain-containing protein